TEPLAAGKLIEKSSAQGLTFEPEVVLHTIVTNIHNDNDEYFTVETSEGDKHYYKTVIITIGGGGMIKPVKLNLENAHLLENKNHQYAVPGIKRFTYKKILMTAGSYSAGDWANDRSPIARE